MSVAALTIWIYSMLTLREKDLLPPDILDKTRLLIAANRYDEALQLCKADDSFTARIISAGLSNKGHGVQVLIESMRSEGRRTGNILWQRLTLLNEIGVIAPMIGLLGTVIGLFFAFYESGSNPDSIASIFDGLGIAVGTTVVGLIVSILAMILYTTLKFKIVHLMNKIENESLALVCLMDQPARLQS
jgi:biopolymer transport protein ExbB